MPIPLLAGAAVAGAGLLSKALSQPGDAVYQRPEQSAYDQTMLEGLDQRANRSEDDYAADMMKGAEQGSALVGGQAQPGGLGGPPEASALQQAIQNRSKKAYERDYSRQGQQAKLDAAGVKRGRVNQVKDLKTQRSQIEQAVRQQEQAAAAQAEMARNNVISSILGGAGSVAGSGAGQKAIGAIGGFAKDVGGLVSGSLNMAGS